MDDHLGFKGHANPDLGWPEKGARFSTNLLEQTLSGEAAINFANGDGSHSSVGLRHGDQTCSGKGRGGSGTSLPLREQVDHGRELLKEAVLISYRHGVQQVLSSEACGSRRGAWREAAQSFHNSLWLKFGR